MKIIFFTICLMAPLLFLPTTPIFAFQEKSITGLGITKKVHAELIMPDGPGPFPGILILHNSAGVKGYDFTFAKQLAQKGYACLIPYYFDAYGISKETRNRATTVYAENILADFTAEIQYLKNQPKINKNEIGAVGFSMGGYWALILAGMKKVHAGVSYYGSMNGGPIYAEVRYHIKDIFTKDSSPVLILHGENDPIVNVKYARQLADSLAAKKCTYELKIYPEAGHNFDRGISLHVPAANDSWRRTLAFLKKYLH